jgi:hypothetical protein
MALTSKEALHSPQHFIGVVENRNDPLNIGRCQVRCFGIHTEDKEAIPTASLPWAQPIMPFNSASLSGVGISPTGPVEGTWVFGMFIDGQELQQPVILGTMVGIPQQKVPKSVGFSDPSGMYPREKYLKQSDVNKLARGDNAWGEESLAVKVRDRIKNVPTAVPPIVASVRIPDGPVIPKSTYHNVGTLDAPGEFYYRNRWSEPNPRYGGGGDDSSVTGDEGHAGRLTCYVDDKGNGQVWADRAKGTPPNKSTYPYNHVYATESGHAMEYDDTPGSERIHQYHTKGTFYEIQPDGSRVTKVVGDDFQMFIKNNNVVVEGNMNLTVKGDVRMFVESNMYTEVKGNYHLKVDGDMITKVQGNEQKVVMTDKATQINGNRRTRITKNDTGETKGDTEWKYIGTANSIHSNSVFVNVTGFERHLMTKSFTCTTGGNTNFVVGSNFTIKSINNVNIETMQSLNVDTANDITFDTPTKFLVGTNNFPANTVILSTRIDLNP